MFNVNDCAVPAVWCGKGAPPRRRDGDHRYYYATGSRYDCMKIGFGAGMHKERKKNLPPNSLQQIKYVGDVYEAKLKKMGISNTDELVYELSSKSSRQIATFLTKAFSKKNKAIDKRAYNSAILFLYSHGISSVPPCSKINV